MKRALICLFLFMFLLAGQALAHENQKGEPTARLKASLDAMIEILNSDKDWDLKKRLIKDQVLDIFDFRELAKRSLGKPWNDMSAEQRDRFTDLFKTLLEKTYLDKITEYNNEQVKFLSERVKGNKAMVMTQVQSAQKTLVNYRMINDERWMVYDVILENVSLIKNYREQFLSITQGVDTKKVGELLISTLNDKIKEVEAKNAEEAAKGGSRESVPKPAS